MSLLLYNCCCYVANLPLRLFSSLGCLLCGFCEALVALLCDMRIGFVKTIERVRHRLGRCSTSHIPETLSSSPNAATARCAFVFIHGMNSFPCQFRTHFDEVEATFKDALADGHIAVCAPRVLRLGHARLHEAVQPILQDIRNFLLTDSSMEQSTEEREGATSGRRRRGIVLVGTSNGGRIAARIETLLRHDCDERVRQSPVMLVSIAGVLHGTAMMNLLSACRVGSCFYPEEVCEELCHKSTTASELVDSLCSPVPETSGEREFVFFSSGFDMVVWPRTTTSPPGLGRSRVIRFRGHSSIVPATATLTMEAITEWVTRLFSIGTVCQQ
eukprot:gnl/Spiro4/9629_TR5106_c0_g1_i1.p1 gnl/Spiro4/9629_TR5106_c0_g1~~gnl/Spiro4/9629_TR5106_c0_g1_i1.p1  ORF type:complete len:357 (-),score=55.67 gnl/Spiro4/9629_TR5106_c0_g1_i1:41-1027(-)